MPRTKTQPADIALAPGEVVPASPSGADRARRSLLRPLGVVGYDDLEPALLAALATTEPLLLLSDHGAAKTLLLLRLAAALGLDVRHYNASLLQFDDLAGFPIPDERGGIRYAAPPGAIWGAEAVFFDEIGRCRPEVANKLFPVVHERRIQGILLERLSYRWAATNPPVEALSADRAEDPYEGVEPLDPALADRFSYVVPLPRFADLSDADRIAVIRGAGERVDPDGPRQVREMVRATRDLLETAEPALEDAVVGYLLALAPALAEAGVIVGGRRAATLRRNLLAVRAACLVLGRRTGESAFAAALLASVPDVARRPIPRSSLIAAHRAAWRHVSLPKADPRRTLEAVRDPARRATLALTLPRLGAGYRGEALCGALAALRPHEAEVLAWSLLPRLLSGVRVPATAVETVATIVARVAVGGHPVRGFGAAQAWVGNARALIAHSKLPTQTAEYLFAVVLRAFSPSNALNGHADDRSWRDPVERCIALWRDCEAALGELLSDDGEEREEDSPPLGRDARAEVAA
jgi:MoxR-like ATPase